MVEFLFQITNQSVEFELSGKYVENTKGIQSKRFIYDKRESNFPLFWYWYWIDIFLHLHALKIGLFTFSYWPKEKMSNYLFLFLRNNHEVALFSTFITHFSSYLKKVARSYATNRKNGNISMHIWQAGNKTKEKIIKMNKQDENWGRKSNKKNFPRKSATWDETAV